MSHASCLVITDNPPTDALLNRVLQPWHEFKCTGVDDQYVKDVDETAEARSTFDADTSRMVRVEDGLLVSAYDDRFYRDPTDEERAKIGSLAGTGFSGGISFISGDWKDGRGYRTKVHDVPEGCNEVTVPTPTVQTFRDFVTNYYGYELVRHGEKPDLNATHKYGYALLDPDGAIVKVVNRTNPNKKWDWWVVGGRYSERLIPTGDRRARLNSCRRDQIDLDAMRELQVAHRQEWAQECCDKAKLTMIDLDAACRGYHPAHATWLELSEPKPRGQEYYAWLEARGGDSAILAAFNRACWEIPTPGANQSIFDWIEAAPALTSWAVVMDDQWFEKGKMGWWGTSSGDQGDWDEKFDDLFGLVRPEQWLTVVDYHI